MINMSLLTGYVVRPFKVAVIKPCLDKPCVVANKDTYTSLPFLCTIPEEAAGEHRMYLDDIGRHILLQRVKYSD